MLLLFFVPAVAKLKSLCYNTFRKAPTRGLSTQTNTQTKRRGFVANSNKGNKQMKELVTNQEFSDCICTHRYNLEKPYQKPEYLRLITALFGYDITKGLTSAMSDDKIYWTIIERFRDIENDKVVLATIGSVLQICETLATPPRDTNQPAENLDFEKFCSIVQRLYGCDLRGYNYGEVGDFRYHVMAYLKGRTQKERNEEQKQKD